MLLFGSAVFGSGSRLLSCHAVFGGFAGPAAMLLAVIVIVLVAIGFGQRSQSYAESGQRAPALKIPSWRWRTAQSESGMGGFPPAFLSFFLPVPFLSQRCSSSCSVPHRSQPDRIFSRSRSSAGTGAFSSSGYPKAIIDSTLMFSDRPRTPLTYSSEVSELSCILLLI
jgi:hypothetical protein